MKILYIGAILDSVYFEKKENKQPYETAQQMFESSLLEGFSLNQQEVEVISLNQEKKMSGQHIRISKEKISSIEYMSYFNIPIIKEICYFFSCIKHVSRWLKKNRESDKIVLTAFNYLPVTMAILVCSKFNDFKRVNIFADISKNIFTKERQVGVSRTKRMLLPYYSKVVNYMDQNFDAYILFTTKMNEMVNPKNKPFIVVEGIYNDSLEFTKDVNRVKAITYSGTLALEYGIEKILEVFEIFNQNDEYELWFIGRGDAEKKIIDYSKKNPQIKLLGFMTRSEVFDKLQQSSLLINLRNPSDDYTFYSFPSKTFEYLVSGTPFFSTKLLGIPEEYDEFMFYTSSYNSSEIAEELKNIFKISDEEMDNRLKKSRSFVLEEKTPVGQSKKILSFLSCLLNSSKGD